MWSYYCDRCDKQLKHDEIELLEMYIEGDYEECCIYCDSQLKVSLNLEIKL